MDTKSIIQKGYCDTYDCEECTVVSGVLIQMCAHCQMMLSQCDANLDSEYVKRLNSKMQSHKLQQKIQRTSLKNEAKKSKFSAKSLGLSVIISKGVGVAYFHYQQLQEIIRKASEKHLYPFYRHYTQEQTCLRGDSSLPLFLRFYKKPKGCYGFPLEVQFRQQLGNQNKKGQWIVAYIPGTVKIIYQILFQKNFPRCYIYQKYQNLNTLSQPISKLVGDGIQCTSYINNSYVESFNFYLQCRINPHTVRIYQKCNNANQYIVNSEQDIVPYRLIIMPKNT